MFILLDGSVQVVTADEPGSELVLARLEAGEHFGEQALLPGSTGRRSAGVRAISGVRVARVSREAFAAVLSRDDALRGRLTQLGAEQAAQAIAKMSSLARALDFGSVAPTRRVLADGEVLFRQGDDADALYLVRSGGLAIWREEGGERSLVARIQQGGCPGELGLVRRQPRTATVTAEGTCEVLRVGRESFEEAYRRSPELRDHLSTLERSPVAALRRSGSDSSTPRSICSRMGAGFRLTAPSERTSMSSSAPVSILRPRS